ncbi:hypothetical protein TNCV_4096781 [Trichonephila clavipes]|nr:hypothetical protein TNCV_4096781 [Trichonephila clavipes]
MKTKNLTDESNPEFAHIKNYIDSLNEMGPESIKAEMIHEHAIVPTDSYHNLPNTLEEFPSLKNKGEEDLRGPLALLDPVKSSSSGPFRTQSPNE